MGCPRLPGHSLSPDSLPLNWPICTDFFNPWHIHPELTVFSKNLQSSTLSCSNLNPNLALPWGYSLYSPLRQCLFPSCTWSAWGVPLTLHSLAFIVSSRLFSCPPLPSSLPRLLSCSQALQSTALSCCSQLQTSRPLPCIPWIFQHLTIPVIYSWRFQIPGGDERPEGSVLWLLLLLLNHSFLVLLSFWSSTPV